MSLEKHYIPTIEEFHIGFEYEDTAADSLAWKERLFSIHTDTIALQESIAGKLTRVKHLDQADIESLGWILKSQDVFLSKYEGPVEWFNTRIPSSLEGRFWEFQLIHDPELFTVTIRATDNYGGPAYSIFEGIVKNKSELRKIMQQIGIIKP